MSAKPITFQKTVAAAVTAEALSTVTALVATVVIQPILTNTKQLIIGDADVAANRGITLGAPVAGDGTTPAAVTFNSSKGDNEIDMTAIYVKVGANGEGVSVTYWKR